MTHTISIDQQFAQVNDLTLTQVATLAAFITLPTWSNNVAINGFVWYMYSEKKMAEDFPLLFGVPKRCYKNITELADMGFVELTKLGRTKYVRFTERCRDWGKGKDQNCTESPKTDKIKSENGQKNSPKTDSNNQDIIITNALRTNNSTADGGLFPTAPVTRERKQPDTHEPRCHFAESKFNAFADFAAQFTAPDFANVDIEYYYKAVADWSAQDDKNKKNDWIATARNFMRRDAEQKKLHTLAQVQQETTSHLDDADLRYLQMCND